MPDTRPHNDGTLAVNEMLRNPLSLFDIRGKVALVTGASGAFGALAAKVLAGAGTRLAISAGNAAALDAVAAQTAARWEPTSRRSNRRGDTEPACEAIVEATVARFGRIDILVVASGKNQVRQDRGHAAGRVRRRHRRQRHPKLADGARAGRRMLAQGEGGKVI
jgi:NAD(P)-dependent dehydrogenase (short-subunit alcohol dehydrogenase family)